MSNRIISYLADSVGDVAGVIEEPDYGPFESRVSVANPRLRIYKGCLCLETYARRRTNNYKFDISEWPDKCNNIEIRVRQCKPDGTELDIRNIYPYDLCVVSDYRASSYRGEVLTEVDLDYYIYQPLANFYLVITEAYYKQVSLTTRKYISYHLEGWKPGDGPVAFDVPVAKFNGLKWLRECLPLTWRFEQEYRVDSRPHRMAVDSKPLTNKLVIEHIINISNDIKEVQV